MNRAPNGHIEPTAYPSAGLRFAPERAAAHVKRHMKSGSGQ